MNDRLLVEALRARDPGALAALYDAHAESVYRYCWFMLRSRDTAQVALRDTLIAAEAQIHALADPDRLRAWLYALARGECVRRRPSMAESSDIEPADADGKDADLRVMAWNAVESLTGTEREALELSTRHALSPADVAIVLRTGVREGQELLDAAKQTLQRAITAEILARKGPYDCPKRARILTGFAGVLTPDLREQVVRHVLRCETCAPHRDRQVSAAKVFALLPVVDLPETLRIRVMSCFSDPDLAPYRRYVAKRAGMLDAHGFPQEPVPVQRRRWPKAVASVAAAAVAAALIALVFRQLGPQPQDAVIDIASGTFPGSGQPPGISVPWRRPTPPDRMRLIPIIATTPTFPLGSWKSTAPVTAVWPDEQVWTEPARQHQRGRPKPSPTWSPEPTPSTPPPSSPPPTQSPEPPPSSPPPPSPPPSTPPPSSPPPSEPPPSSPPPAPVTT